MKSNLLIQKKPINQIYKWIKLSISGQTNLIFVSRAQLIRKKKEGKIYVYI